MTDNSYKPQTWEKISVFAIIALIILTILFLIIRNQPFSDPNYAVMTRILISLCVSVLGALIPGFLSIDWSLKGTTIRAGGAMALFVLTYMYTPNVFSNQFGNINNKIESNIFVAAYNIELLKEGFNAYVKGDPIELETAQNNLSIMIENHDSWEDSQMKLGHAISRRYGLAKYHQFNCSIKIVRLCMNFSDGKIPWAIGLELEQNLSSLTIPEPFKRVPLNNSLVWLKDIHDYYIFYM